MRSALIIITTFLITFSFSFSQTQYSSPSKSIDPKDDYSKKGYTKGSQAFELDSEEAPIHDQLNDFKKTYRFSKPTSSLYDTLILNTRGFKSYEVPKYNPQVISQRLYELPTVIPMDYNYYVQRYIEVYTVKKREQVSRMIGLSKVYFPLFEEELDKLGMPIELKYLSVVESALNPHARSRVGATGLWQFMLSTGRLYGLQVNSFVDERKDPLKATRAALKYLKRSHGEFGNWLLAIAAYNCGDGNVRKAIRRSGGSRNFWEIRQYLPRETRGYVPAFIAATYAFNYASEHNLYPVYTDFSIHQDTIHITKLDITLPEIAEMTNTDVDELRNLNPELKLDRIPYSSRPYTLRVPSKVAEYFAAYSYRINQKYGQKRNQSLTPVNYASSASTRRVTSSTRKNSYPRPAGTGVLYYTVRSGDVVGSIAERYKVSPRQIAAWNNLRRYRIKVGQKLKIYTTKDVARRAGARIASAPVIAQRQSTFGNGSYHTVRKGETIWGIAGQYDDVDVDRILALNRGLDPKDMKIGQRIRIK